MPCQRIGRMSRGDQDPAVMCRRRKSASRWNLCQSLSSSRRRLSPQSRSWIELWDLATPAKPRHECEPRIAGPWPNLPRAGNLGVQGLHLRAGTRRRTCLSARAEKTENFDLPELSPVMHCGNAARGIGCLIECHGPQSPRGAPTISCRAGAAFRSPQRH